MSRVLVVSHNAFSLHGNNGKTLNSIFSKFRPEDVAQCFFNADEPESDLFFKFARLDDVSVFRRKISLGWYKGFKEVRPQPKRNNFIIPRERKLTTAIKSFIRRNEWLKISCRELVYSGDCWFSDELRAWVNDFCPDSVFLVGGNSPFAFKIAKNVSSYLNVPLDLFLTDDYVLNAVSGNCMQNLLNARLKKVYAEFVPQCRNVFVIGDLMAQEFEAHYHRKFVPVMNCVAVPAEVEYKSKIGLVVKVVYMGGLHLGRHDSLIELGRALTKVAQRVGRRFEFEVYSIARPSDHIIRRFAEVGIHYGGALARDMVDVVLEKADFVVHVESFDEKNIAKTKLSVSTKLPEYFASGTPLIVFGPESIASVQLVKDNDLGLVLTNKKLSDNEIESISRFVENDFARYRFVSKAHMFALERFEVNKVSETFKNTVA